MSDTTPIAIDVCNVTKRFKLSNSASSLKTAVLDLIRRRNQETFTALDNVSFKVHKGETLGLIGANGAGKSTMLSIIAGTMYPTIGSVTCSGTISSLLELGAGFHPDLTGRENVLLYGSIMGISREDMRKKFDAIVDFSGLKDFIDQPVRFYSSGMYVRLGFAVAVQVDPEILLVDEVFAVGDADFQRKCLDKMDEFKSKGKSMLIISHDMHTIRSISDRIAYLDHGVLKGIGSPNEMAAQYGAATINGKNGDAKREWGTGEARISSAKLVDSCGNPISIVNDDQQLFFELEYDAPERIETPTFGFSITDEAGRTVFGSNTELEGFDLPYIKGKGKLMLKVDAKVLRSGNYMMSFSLHNRNHTINYHRLENHIPIYLPTSIGFDGMCKLPVEWN